MFFLILFVFFQLFLFLPITGQAENLSCPQTCQAPGCFCPSSNPPGGLSPKDTPQFILLTFDDAVDENAFNFVTPVLNRKNFHHFPLLATFFVTTDWSDFWLIQRLYAQGHEIGIHTMTHTTGVSTPAKIWNIEINGARQALSRLSQIPLHDLSGFRAPYLKYNEASFDVIYKNHFLYDSSMLEIPGHLSAGVSSYSWPYTLDQGVMHKCWTGKCPKKNYPELFEIPLWALFPEDKTWKAAMDPEAENEKALFDLLKSQFLKRYEGNRAPFGVFLHASWLKESFHGKALESFFDWAFEFQDVWPVTMNQLIEFMKNPASSSEISKQPYMQFKKPVIGAEICDGFDNNDSGEVDEGLVHSCNYEDGSFRTCSACPSIWPTARHPDGSKIRKL